MPRSLLQRHGGALYLNPVDIIAQNETAPMGLPKGVDDERNNRL
jgi:hypothetical protein